VANKVTDPALLRLLESGDTPPAASGGRRVTDPALLAQLDAPEQPVAMVPSYDTMGNPTGSMEPASPLSTMTYGQQLASVGGVLDKGVRILANGATFGMADRIAGGMDALTGQAPSYSEGVDAQHAQTKVIKDANPVLAGVGEAAGGLLTGAGLVKNGITLAGRVGSGLVPRILGYGAEGAAYGAVAGAGGTYSGKPQDYIDNAMSGAGTGAAIGTAMPVIGAAAGGLYRAATAVGGRNIEGVNRAGSAAMRAAAQADEAGLRALPTMGPEAMLPDAGPSMLGLAQGAATSNGPGRSALVNALAQRDAGTGQRLASAVDGAIGPAPIPSRVETGIRASRRALSPQYEAALENARAVNTRPIADSIEAMIPDARGPVRTALEQVRSDLNIPGNTAQLDPSPRALLNVRHAIDDALEGAPGNVKAALQGLRRSVDDELAAKVPGVKAVDARYAELARQSEGLERGQTIFDTSRAAAIRPAELADEIAAGAIPQGQMVGPSAVPMRVRQGARAELDRVVGTQVNDLNAMERTLGTPQDWNQQKAALVFGQEPVDQIVKAIRTNRTFRNSLQRIAQGSDTAARTESAKLLEAGEGIKGDSTAVGLATMAFQRIARAMMGANSRATKDQVAQTMANPNVRMVAEALLSSAGRAREGAANVSRALTNPAYLAGASAPGGGQ